MDFSKLNKKLYTNLRKKFVAKNALKQDMRKATDAIKSSLLPRRQQGNDNAAEQKAMRDSIANNKQNYNKQLGAVQQGFDAIQKDSAKKIANLQRAIENDKKVFRDYTRNNQEAFKQLGASVKQLYDSKQQEQAQAAQQPAQQQQPQQNFQQPALLIKHPFGTEIKTDRH